MSYSSSEAITKINKSLGLYKAEWLNEAIFDLFNEPVYFDELKTHRPCLLIGGRGTGKTTVLRGLSYEGQYASLSTDKNKIADWPFYGMYYRVNTNRVTAFRGPEIDESSWTRYFSHYVNLTFCKQILDFIKWYKAVTKCNVELNKTSIKMVCLSLGINEVLTLEELSEELEYSIIEFEISVNSIIDTPPKNLSILSAPIDLLTKSLCSLSIFRGKQFYFLIDEFENFEDYQQIILNTIIKHSNNYYTFKIGVRELGWRQRGTLNANESLISPADYARISISERLQKNNFEFFAKKVITDRLKKEFIEVDEKFIDPTLLLTSISEREEAEILVGPDDYNKTLDNLSTIVSKKDLSKISTIERGMLGFLKYLSPDDDTYALKEYAFKYLRDPSLLRNEINNHFYAYLFTLKRGKTGVRKFYCGWDVYLLLANGNIRYLIELVHAAFINHIESDGILFEPISPKIQTDAATQIGKKNLSELEGLSVDGAKLTKLVLSLGRIFQVMASGGKGHSPEVNQFHIKSDSTSSEYNEAVKNILKQAVMHLALERTPGNKLIQSQEIQEYDYRLHPIFSPFFNFSHRKKRKFPLDENQFINLIDNPAPTIKAVLKKRNISDDESLPDQLNLFGSFYAG
ncbi:hypothetical protein HA49_07425 [Tatumella morbirosei]|uniref:Uncharacterized protein n=1 Tax=Tatumella morbirosei TaxID=642227 RepID=A0A095VKI8_9GAMM|nr:hypothetical protein [Tatumella morbirosei]KGD75090.1 hypothetical protein HA49_07425 [Tatumella morbirosei]